MGEKRYDILINFFHGGYSLILSYANIWLKNSTVFCRVLNINFNLTFISSRCFLILYQNLTTMKISPSNINWFLIAKLPSAYLCGVRVKEINSLSCTVRIRESFLNKNPFNSIYFAAQSMAAELSTGALVMQEIQQSGQEISMLVTNCRMDFKKKAKGKILFSCNQGAEVSASIVAAIESKEGQILNLHSQGVNMQGDIVSEMVFEWSIKLKVSKR